MMYKTTLGPSRILKEVHSISDFYAIRVFVGITSLRAGPFACSPAETPPSDPLATNYNENVTGSWGITGIDENRIWFSQNYGLTWDSMNIPDEDKPTPDASGVIDIASFGPWEFFDESHGAGGLVGAGNIDTKHGPLSSPLSGGVFGLGTSHNFEGLCRPFVSSPVCVNFGGGIVTQAATYGDWQLVGPLHIDISAIRFKLPPRTGQENKRIMEPYAVAMQADESGLWVLFKEEV